MGKNIKAVQNIEVTGLWAIKQWGGSPGASPVEEGAGGGKMGNGGRRGNKSHFLSNTLWSGKRAGNAPQMGLTSD